MIVVLNIARVLAQQPVSRPVSESISMALPMSTPVSMPMSIPTFPSIPTPKPIQTTPSSSQGDIITTIAGTGTSSYSGDGGAATSATLNYPAGVALDASGRIL